MLEAKYSCKVTMTLASIFFAVTLCFGQEPQPTPTTTTAASVISDTKPTEPITLSSKPIIYFYRIKQFAGSALEPSVYCDDREIARMDNGRYFGVALEPGKHTCRMGDKQTGFELDMKPGEEYYAKITIDVGFWKGHGRLTLLQKEQGAFELKKVKLLGVDKVKDRSLVTLYEGSENKP